MGTVVGLWAQQANTPFVASLLFFPSLSFIRTIVSSSTHQFAMNKYFVRLTFFGDSLSPDLELKQ